VERDIGCGARIGGYLLGSGIILGRTSAGDWTSNLSRNSAGGFGCKIPEAMESSSISGRSYYGIG